MSRSRIASSFLFRCLLALSVAGLAAPAARARVDVTLDAETLTKVLAVITPPTVHLPLPSGGQIALELSEVRVSGFDPAAAGRGGHILTALRLRVPALGIDLPLEPRLSLEVREDRGEKACFLRFEKMSLPLPMMGSIDASAFIPSFRIPTDSAWILPVSQGNVHVKSRLVETRIGSQALRLGFEVDAAPAEPGKKASRR